MASILVSLISIVLLCIIAAQGIKALYPSNELPASSSVTNDGICDRMVRTRGYTCEEHQVTTEDGYILSMQRIPTGRSGKKADKPPVILQNGILTDSTVWVFNSPDESLAFILADNGFDVWLANTRGTRYSKMHRSLSPDDPRYWEWSWDELASNDLPASIQYVYNQTGQKMHYVGDSLGTLTALGAFSQGQLLNMLRSAALLSPIAHLDQIPSKLLRLLADTFIANKLYWLGLHEFIPYGDTASRFMEHMCDFLRLNCSTLLTLLTGPNCCLNSSNIDDFLYHELQRTATKNLIHLSQMVRTGKIAKYDYGNYIQNMQHYGQPDPPIYDMAKIPNGFPLFLSHGGQDILSDTEDVKVLLSDLKDHDGNKLVVVFKEDYAHGDFVLGVNAKQVVYDPMISFFNAN